MKRNCGKIMHIILFLTISILFNIQTSLLANRIDSDSQVGNSQSEAASVGSMPKPVMDPKIDDDADIDDWAKDFFNIREGTGVIEALGGGCPEGPPCPDDNIEKK